MQELSATEELFKSTYNNVIASQTYQKQIQAISYTSESKTKELIHLWHAGE